MIEKGTTGSAWTEGEVAAIVAVYFQMLRMQELGQTFNKSEFNRRLQGVISARNLASIEYKHRNISAVLNLFGAQALIGYKPLPNFQRLLVDEVAKALELDSALDAAAIRRVETPAEPPALGDFNDFLIQVPASRVTVSEQRIDWVRRKPIKRDYLEREARNRSLGMAGELLVMEYEARRLHDMGAKKFADRIDHVSRTRGDGAGYDILSFDGDGRERYIEVKTTAYVAETPFFVTPNELGFSSDCADSFHLYRLFAFRDKPRMFTLPGAIAAHCLLDPVSYRATLLASQI